MACILFDVSFRGSHVGSFDAWYVGVEGLEPLKVVSPDRKLGHWGCHPQKELRYTF